MKDPTIILPLPFGKTDQQKKASHPFLLISHSSNSLILICAEISGPCYGIERVRTVCSYKMRMLTFTSSSSSSSNEEREERFTPVYLNVYDLTPVNNYLYWFGLGIFHSGIEAHGLEYGFGAHEYPTSGVFEVEPRSCPGFIFRRSVMLGTTKMSRSEFRSFMEKLSRKYNGDTYHLIAKNCNHFTEEVCLQLTGKAIPGWINRMARVGSFCNCLLPESIQNTTVRHLPERLEFSDEDEDGSESVGSEETEGEEGSTDHHHLISSSNSDIAFLQEQPVRII